MVAAFLLCISLASCAPHQPAPVMHFGANVDSPTGAMIVREGDTLWSIATRYRLPLRDIIDLNNMHPPYHLAAGQRLRLPPPAEYKVGANDTLHRVSRMFNVSLSQLVRMNNLRAPYGLRVGQTLRLPSRSGRTVTLAQKPAPRQQVQLPASSSRVEKQALPVPPKATVTPSPTVAVVKKPSYVPQPQNAGRRGYVWPVKGRIISSYGPKKGGLYNDGINIAVPRGTPVAAAADGKVAYVGDGLKSYGNLVLIRHSGGMVTAYAHLSAVSVRQGMTVKKGQVIGAVGETGAVDSPQLHFEVRNGTRTIDPKTYLG
ncbi:MAG: M23 family metallopeptidase [Alphaproteobacteria bacterium]|nr:M23 family metallopeptidase [Alphaproteobacteria bacterium]